MPKILIVDGDHDTRTQLASHFEAAGYLTIVCDEGSLAERVLGLNPDFDVLIFDSNLPDMNGRELTTRLRKVPSLAKIPIIIVAAKMKLSDIDEFLELGASYFVPKPIRIDQLKETVAKILAKSKR